MDSLQPPFDAQDYARTPASVKKYLEHVIQVAANQQTYLKALESETNSVRQQVVKAAERAARRRRTSKLVVFVSDVPRAREAKLACGLNQTGWRVILLHRDVPTFDAAKYCVEVHRYQNPWEALMLAIEFSPEVYHVFSNWNFSVAAALVRHKPGKVIFDDYDVMAGMVKEEVAHRQYPGQLELERFCLENADGLCCRSLETQYAKRVLKYKLAGRRIFFPEYCWGEMSGVERKSSPNSPVSFCYIGNIGPPGAAGGYHCDLVEQLRAQIAKPIAYHVYPTHEHLVEKYRVLIKDRQLTDCIKLHRPVPNGQLLTEISGFHVGVHVGNLNLLDRVSDAYDLDRKRKYSMSNKIFDYLDAGLLVLIGDQRLQSWLLRRVGAAIRHQTREPADQRFFLTLEEMEERRRRHGQEGMVKLSVRHQVRRLERFYLSLQ